MKIKNLNLSKEAMPKKEDFVCSFCNAIQSYAPKGVRGGITEKEAYLVGWIRIEGGGWLCPNCSGNQDKLDQVFGQ